MPLTLRLRKFNITPQVDAFEGVKRSLERDWAHVEDGTTTVHRTIR